MSHSVKNVLVIGLGKTGTSVCSFLKNQGAQVYVAEDRADLLAQAENEGFNPLTLTGDWPHLDYAVVSPGVPWCWPAPHPFCLKARQLGLALINDVDLFALRLRAEKPDAQIIAITGTNGKSTTTALMHHVLDTLSQPNTMGGNIGVPVLDLPLQAGTYVLELSSYQLELCRSLFPHIGILLNITPDHLTRHGGMASYTAAKAHVFEGMSLGGYGVISVDDSHCSALYEHFQPAYVKKLIPISTRHALSYGVYLEKGVLMDAIEAPHAVGPLDEMPTLRGEHNWQNMLAVYAALRCQQLQGKDIWKAFKTFPGLAHRQEHVGQKNNVTFINDSKATNVDSVAKALPYYDNIYWIVGGQAKEGGLKGLESWLGRIRHAYLIGEAAQDFANYLAYHQVPHTVAGTLDKAVDKAAHAAFESPDDSVVLLSPACASWDQFKSFEERGDVFRAAVQHVMDKKGLS